MSYPMSFEEPLPFGLFAACWAEKERRLEEDLWDLSLAPAGEKREKRRQVSAAPILLNKESNEKKEEKEEEEEKEPVVYKRIKANGLPGYAMVFLALLNANGAAIGMKDIYAFIQKVFTNYSNIESNGWKGTVRHQLSRYETSVTQKKKGRSISYALIEGSQLHLKFEQFCEENPDSSKFCIAEEFSWDDVKKGLVGIPKIEATDNEREHNARSRKRKPTDEDDKKPFSDDLLNDSEGFRKKRKNEDLEAYTMALLQMYRKPFAARKEITIHNLSTLL